jgi:hypothetical protein
VSNRYASSSGAWSRPSFYPSSLQPKMQDLLRTLADIDFEHDAALDRLEESAEDPSLKGMLLERLKAHHRARREPVLRKLAELQAKATRRRTGLRRFI